MYFPRKNVEKDFLDASTTFKHTIACFKKCFTVTLSSEVTMSSLCRMDHCKIKELHKHLQTNEIETKLIGERIHEQYHRDVKNMTHRGKSNVKPETMDLICDA